MVKRLLLFLLIGSVGSSAFAIPDIISGKDNFGLDLSKLLGRFSGGTVTTPLGTDADVIRAGAFQTDHKLVVAGRSEAGGSGMPYSRFAIARYFPDGTLDPTFGNNGSIVGVYPTNRAILHAVAVDSESRIVVAGRGPEANQYDLWILRYLSSGALDTDFDGNGWVRVDIQNEDFARGLALQPDDKIVVGGYSGLPGSYDFSVARFNTDGSLDTNFSGDGKVTTPILAANDVASAVALDSDSRVIVAGSTDNGSNLEFAIVRYGTDGVLDNTFHTDGITNFAIGTDAHAFAVYTQSDNKILVAGRSDNGSDYDFAVAKLLENGDLDTNFDTDGIRTDPILAASDSARGIVLDTSDRLLIGGRTYNGSNWDFAIARYLTNGALDATFNTDGINTHAVGGGDDVGHVMLYDRQKTLLLGVSNNGSNNDFAIARYNSDGSLAADGDLDLHFGTDGIHAVDIGSGTTDFVGDAVRDSQGRILVAGDNGSDFAVTRFLSTGALDNEFHTDGIATFDVGGVNDVVRGADLDDRDQIVTVGDDGADFQIVRFATDGSKDTVATVDINATDNAYDVAVYDEIYTDSRFVVVGSANVGGGSPRGDIAVARFLSTGVLDTSFHTDGWMVYDRGNKNQYGRGVALDTNGRIVVTGSDNENDLVILRLLTDGAYDTTFHTDGVQTLSLGVGSTLEYANVALIQTDGKILIGGNKENDLMLTRLLANGDLDTTFGVNGENTIAVGGASTIEDLKFASNGKIIAVGSQGGDMLIVRYKSDGTSDTSFHTDGYYLRSTGTTDTAVAVLIEPDDRILTAGEENPDFAIRRHWP